MNRIFLIDYENVAEYGLNGLFDIGCNDSCYIFYTDKSNKISFDFLERFAAESKSREIKFLKSASGKNALDFQLSSFLGALIEKNGVEESEYVIISKDNGFCCLSTLWAKERPGIKIIYAPSIARITNSSDNKAASPSDKAGQVSELKTEAPVENGSPNKDTDGSAAAPPKQKAPQADMQLTSHERAAMNTAIQQTMSGAKYDAKTINEVASFVSKAYKESKGKKEIYTWLIQKYKRDKGLEIYNVIKSALK